MFAPDEQTRDDNKITRDANRSLTRFFCFFRVLLRVRMLYYIKHEIIGDLVQHITDGVQAR